MNEKLIIGITFTLYLFVMLMIGWYFYVRTKNLSDYTLGGRKLGYWGTSISAQASDMSGWLLLGLPGAAFLTGLSGSVWMAGGLAIGTYLNWKLIAKKLIVDTQKCSDSNSFSMAFIGIISSLAWGLGYFGQPHILTKFMAIEDPEEITVSRKIALPCGLY